MWRRKSLNNPIRLLLGWAIVAPTTLPPSSLMLGYWMGGAFLMTVKRLAEYRTISATHGAEVLGAYRRSFRYYNADRLLILAFLFALLAAFFIAIFLIKYRIEYLLSFPLFALLFTTYLRMGLKRGSNAQTPERLFEERLLMAVVAVLVVTLVLLTVIDIPSLGVLSEPHFFRLLVGVSPVRHSSRTIAKVRSLPSILPLCFRLRPPMSRYMDYGR